MRFLANENFPVASIKLLREAGHDVAAVIEVSPGSSDQHILEWANREKRIIITFDRDYGELVFKEKLSVIGVVYFRFNPNTPEGPAEYILRTLDLKNVSLERMFTIIERLQIRQRLLP